MRRFEITYGPTEFVRFDSQQECVADMRQRLDAIVEQEGCVELRVLAFARGLPGPTPNPSIRMVAIATERGAAS